MGTFRLALVVLLCGLAVLLGMTTVTAYAQAIPEPGEPHVIGWFCPNCGELVPTGQSTCGCGFSLNDGGGSSEDTSGGGYSGGGTTTTTTHRPARPRPPAVSAEERRQREIFAREKQALLEAFKLPEPAQASPAAMADMRPPNALTDPVVPVRFQQATGLSDAEWARARASQAEIDEITREWPVPEKHRARLENLLTERNTLWDKAVSAPGLTADDRDRLRLRLFTVPQFGNDPVPAVTAAALQEMRQDPAPSTTPVAHPVAMTMLRQSMIDGTVAIAEQAGEEWADELLGEAAGARFGTVLGLAKVAIAAREDTAEGLAALGDVLVGFIPIPQANLALAGGRVYGNVAFQAMNNFMTESMRVTGGTVDTEAFWKELDDELSVNHRAYRKWVGFGF